MCTFHSSYSEPAPLYADKVFAPRAIITSTLVVLLLMSGCLNTQKEPTDDVPADLVSAIDAFYRAIENGDVEARIDLFDDDAIMLPNHGSLIQGEGAVTGVIRGGDGAVFRIRDRTIAKMEVSGDLAYTANTYSFTYHQDGAEPQWHKTKNVHIWKRDSLGYWKIQVDIWNSDVPMEMYATE